MQSVTLDAVEQQREDVDAPPERVYRNCRRISYGCGLFVAAVGVGRILSKTLEYLNGEAKPFLRVMAGRFSEHDAELALMTGVCFVLFGLALTVAARRRSTKGNRVFVHLICLLVVLWSAYKLLAFLLAWLAPQARGLYTDGDLPARFAVQPMSWLSSLLLLNAGLGLLFADRGTRERRAAAVFALLTAMLSTVLLLGYAHGVQLLNAVVGTPVALLSALVFVVLSVGLICRIDPRYFPLRPFIGSSARALLLRTFLPIVFALVLLDALFQGAINDSEDKRQRMSIFSSLLVVASFCAVILVVSYVSRIIGNTIDKAERARDRALREAHQARDAAETANEQLRQTNHDLSEARDAAEAANRTKSQFLANMNHELRTPLNSIILYAEELMIEHQGETALVADLQTILDRGKHLVVLINDILEHAKLEANMVRLEPTVFHLSEVARDVAATIEPLAKKNGNTLRLECPLELGTMYADATRVKQCLLNLLSNANKFTSNGTIALRVRRDAVEGKDWITFQVTDTGIGMTPEQQERIFQRFVQADASTTRRYGGTGLGLSISRGLSQLMGGDLVLERSEPNVGSTFTLRLPAGAPPAAVESPRVPPAAVPAADGRNTVLVIDDDRNVRDMLIRQLSKEGFHVIAVGEGEEALRLAHEMHPQVITLDVMMPGMDGWSVLSALKSDPATADIPVIIVSIIDDKNLGFSLGASDYLVKPTSSDRLIDVLKRFCNFPSSGLALVAEDDPAMREMLRRVLEKEKWAVAEAANGREALACMAQQRPSLILLDLMMPEMDGFEFLAELQHHPEWTTIPVVVITAKELGQEDRLFLNGSLLLSGCVKRVLQKGSFSREELLGQVRELISRGASA